MLVKHDLPLVNPCWLCLITFLSSMWIEMHEALHHISREWGGRDGSVVLSPPSRPNWRLRWHLISCSSQAPLLIITTFQIWLWAAYLWCLTVSLSTCGCISSGPLGLLDIKLACVFSNPILLEQGKLFFPLALDGLPENKRAVTCLMIAVH